MIVPQYRLGQFTVTRGTIAFERGILMNRESRRVDSKFDKLAGLNVLFDYIRRYLEVLRVLNVLGNTVDQLVIVSEMLIID